MWINLLINLVAGVIIFVVGVLWPIIPKSYRKYQIRKFWGKGSTGNQFAIVYGALKDSRVVFGQPVPANRFVKYYPNGRAVNLPGPFGNIVGDCEIRASSYIINSLSSDRKDVIPVIPDEDAFKILDRTIVSFGSPSSNLVSDLILREPRNRYVNFGQTNGMPCINNLVTQKQHVGFQGPSPKDIGLILKIQNERFPNQNLFVCAGLGESGTSGAAWYLARHWRKFRNQADFGIVLEVEIGSDESARII